MNAISVSEKKSSEESSSWRYFRTDKFFVAAPKSMEFVDGAESPSHSSISTLSALKLPQHFLDLLKEMPMQNALDGIFLVEPLRHAPARQGHDFLYSDSGNRHIYLDAGADNHIRNLFHEIGHVVLDTTRDTELMYAIACASEPAMLGQVGVNTPEDWARHFEIGLFAPEATAFEQFCHACPIRAMVMARCLLDGWTNTIDTGWVGELRFRLQFIEDSIATIARLMLITAVYASDSEAARMDALVLLLRYGHEDQLTMLAPAVLELDLSGTVLTADEITRVRTWTSIESLDLSRTAVTDQSVCELHTVSALRTLSLRQTKVTDVGVSGLISISLNELDLRDTAIGALSAAHLGKMSTLKRLRLSASALPDGALEELKASLPDCFVDIG